MPHEITTETYLKHYLDKYHIPYSDDKENMKLVNIQTGGLTQRQIKLIKRLIKIDGFTVDSQGFDLLRVNLGHFGGLK